MSVGCTRMACAWLTNCRPWSVTLLKRYCPFACSTTGYETRESLLLQQHAKTASFLAWHDFMTVLPYTVKCCGNQYQMYHYVACRGNIGTSLTCTFFACHTAVTKGPTRKKKRRTFDHQEAAVYAKTNVLPHHAVYKNFVNAFITWLVLIVFVTSLALSL